MENFCFHLGNKMTVKSYATIAKKFLSAYVFQREISLLPHANIRISIINLQPTEICCHENSSTIPIIIFQKEKL